RFSEMDKDKFWSLTSGRTVGTVLFKESLTGRANSTMRSFTIDFNCSLTKALFTDDEWNETKGFEKFELLLPDSKLQYIKS
ncbi:hypothetical protein BGZ49_002637, partial [Haplosporangium sp. Z 27]